MMVRDARTNHKTMAIISLDTCMDTMQLSHTSNELEVHITGRYIQISFSDIINSIVLKLHINQE